MHCTLNALSMCIIPLRECPTAVLQILMTSRGNLPKNLNLVVLRKYHPAKLNYLRLGGLAQNGFARISVWRILDTVLDDDGSVCVIFVLTNDIDQEEVLKWSYKFEAQLSATLNNVGLEVKFSVENLDKKPFDTHSLSATTLKRQRSLMRACLVLRV